MPPARRARRWHGDGDGAATVRRVAGRPRRPDRSASPHGPRLPRAVWWIIETRNNDRQPRRRLGPQGPKLRAQRWPRPVSLLKSKTPPRLRTGGDGATKGRSCAKSTKPAVWRRIAPPTISTEPRRNGGAGVATPACCGRLHVPSPTLAVRCLYVTKDGSPTRRPASLLWSSYHRASVCGRELRQGRSGLVVGALTWPASGAQAGAAVTRGCRVGHVSIRERGLCVLVLL